MSHHCHARECQAQVSPELLCCAKHWRMVPRSIQRAVYKTYRHGQCDDKHPSREWHAAAAAAIGWIAMREGRKLTTQEAWSLMCCGYRMSIVREYVKRLGESERVRIEETLDKIIHGKVAAE